MIPQRSTNLAQLCLTSEIGRDRVYSEWFDRGMLTLAKRCIISVDSMDPLFPNGLHKGLQVKLAAKCCIEV